jgi:hypothetical protein
MPATSSIEAHRDDEQPRAFQQVFVDRRDLPTGASVIDEPVTVVEVTTATRGEG